MTLHAFEPKDTASKEACLQRYLVQLLLMEAHPLVYHFAVLDGDAKSESTADKLKSLGVKTDVVSYAVILPDGVTGFIRLKAPRVRLTPEQRAFEAHMKRVRTPFAVCRTQAEIRGVLGCWGALSSRRAVEAAE